MRGIERGFSVRMFAVACCAMLLVTLPHEARGDSEGADELISPANLLSKDMFKSIPADYFIENAGQLGNQDVRLYTTSGDMQIGFAESAVLIKMMERPPTPVANLRINQEPLRSPPLEPVSSRGVLLRLDFEGANKVTPQGRNPLPHPINFFIGNDPAHWRTNVRSYREVVYEGLYDGVDLIYRTTDKGVKYEFVLAPGTDTNVIKITYEGARSIELGAAGNLLVHTTIGDIGDSSPIAYQGMDDVRCSILLLAPSSYGFACNGVDKSREIVIDPLLYSTYLGGSGGEMGYSIAVDSVGDAYVTGNTGSTDFPLTAGAFDTTYNGSSDAFVTKLDPTGSSLLYSSYLGGGSIDGGFSIAVDSAGNAFVAGYTISADFPVTAGAFDTTYNGSSDAFVTKLDPTGSSLLYSSYLGGRDWDDGYSIAVDSAGNAYVTGDTSSADFPVTPGVLDATLDGFGDAFVTKLDSTGGSLLYSSYLGGGGWEEGNSIAVDSAGNALLTGYTGSTDFPFTAGAFDTTYNSGDAFVAKLDLTGSSLLYSTYLGGGSSDGGYSIAVDSAGNAFVTGGTISADFPVTASAFDTTYNSGDAFVVKLGPVVVNFPPRAYNPGVQGFISSPGILHITDNTPELNWTYNDPDGDPQASYDSRVGTAPGLGNMWDSPATSGSATVVTYGGGALLRGADYYFGVKVNDSYSWSPEVEVKFHMNSIPNAPTTPITPAQSLTVPASSSQTVSWTTGGDNESDVITYDWQVSTDSTFASTLVQGIGIGTTSASFATTPSATYFWRVRARDDYEPANWSEYDDSPLGHWTFSTSPPPNTPPTVTITSPTGGEEFLKGSSQTITWTMTDDTTPNANLTIYINYTTGGVTSQLVAALKGQVSFAWTLPNIEANDVVVNITVIDSGGLKGWSQSDPITIKAPSSPPPDFLSQYWWLIVVIVAVVIALLLLALMKRRKPKEEKEEVQPPEPQNPPRSE